MGNDWHEKGEWPQIGFRVEAMVLAGNTCRRFEKGSVINYVRTPNNFKAALFSTDSGELFIVEEKRDFRPIKSDRQIFIERITKEWQSYNKTLPDFFADQYDKGLRYPD